LGLDEESDRVRLYEGISVAQTNFLDNRNFFDDSSNRSPETTNCLVSDGNGATPSSNELPIQAEVLSGNHLNKSIPMRDGRPRLSCLEAAEGGRPALNIFSIISSQVISWRLRRLPLSEMTRKRLTPQGKLAIFRLHSGKGPGREDSTRATRPAGRASTPPPATAARGSSWRR